METQDGGLGRQLLIEAAAGAAAAVAVAVLARRTRASRRRRQSRQESNQEGSPDDLGSMVLEYLLLRLGFRAVMQSVRFTGRRMLN
jgi:hypothetical protein